MPINAKPEYFKAEKKYHEATTVAEKIAALEEMSSTAPAHKGAENLRAQIKQRLAKLRAGIEKTRQASKGKGSHMKVKREGYGQVMLVSVTNAGKSSLLAALLHCVPLSASATRNDDLMELVMVNGTIQTKSTRLSDPCTC